MGASSGFALKFVQMFVRGVQFCCAALVLALFSYFLATLHNHGLDVDTWIQAVEGISGVGVLYTAIGILLVCCVAGHPLTSGIAVFFDIAFIAGFIYVASANRGGAGSCDGIVTTPFGTGDADTQVVDNGHGGFTTLPSFRQACKMESACLAVSIVAIFFFVFSILIEVALVRHRRKENRFGPGPQNDYTSGYTKGRSLFGWRRKRNTGLSDNPNILPEHTHPDQVRDSYATEQTGVGATTEAPASYNKYGESGYGQQAGRLQQGAAAHTAYPSRSYNYEDGVYDRT